jgi:dihydrodipicolinate synthase/N-acetylneuraminate lyase
VSLELRIELISASHLSREERRSVVKTGRKALDDAGFKDEPLLVGTGGGSAATTIELTQDAAEEGATHSIVICPGRSAMPR